MTITEETVRSLAPLIRARLRGLMERESLTIPALVERVKSRGRQTSLSTIQRWLSGSYDMSLDQVDILLEAIGTDRESLMWPVITETDRRALKYLTTKWPTRGTTFQRIPRQRQLRLAAEGMVKLVGDKCEITDAGRAYLEASHARR